MNKDTIQDLLERGLHFYGLGEVEEALRLWREVLALEPGNAAAQEYLAIEVGSHAAPGAAADSSAAPAAEEETIEEPEALPAEEQPGYPEFARAQSLLGAERWSEAEAAFRAAHLEDPANPLYFAYLELARAQLIRDTVRVMGDLSQVPRLVKSLKEVSSLALDQEEGFILSLINGEISFEDLIAISPIARGDTYRILRRFLAEGVIRT